MIALPKHSINIVKATHTIIVCLQAPAGVWVIEETASLAVCVPASGHVLQMVSIYNRKVTIQIQNTHIGNIGNTHTHTHTHNIIATDKREKMLIRRGRVKRGRKGEERRKERGREGRREGGRERGRERGREGRREGGRERGRERGRELGSMKGEPLKQNTYCKKYKDFCQRISDELLSQVKVRYVEEGYVDNEAPHS